MILRNYLKGLLIGLGFIVPGVSGGVIATILGIYDIVITKILNFTDDVKNNFLFLLPLALGIISSVLIFSKLILYLTKYKIEFISYVFIGLILGCLPYLVKEIKVNTKKNLALGPFILALGVGIILFLIENNLNIGTSKITTFTLLVAGLFYAIGKIVPGISGAALLMLLGVYEYFLNIIANPLSLTLTTLTSLLPFFISFIISAFFILKLMNYLLKNHFRYTYSAIIGFIISSILFILPPMFSFSSLIIAGLSFLISYSLSN